jgi:cation diffusion facilitator family transporter
MSGCGCEIEVQDRDQRGVLRILLLINAIMFVAELGTGWVGQSTSLIADAMDMFADALVYGLALYAVGRSAAAKLRAARLSGLFQIALGIGVGVDIARRVALGSEPQSLFMLGVGLVALVANVVCLVLIARHRHGEVHMRASWIFSKNDVIANLGVIGGGLLVHWSGNRWPDLVVGAAIAVMVFRGGLQILKEATGGGSQPCAADACSPETASGQAAGCVKTPDP